MDGDLDYLVEGNLEVGTALATKRPARRTAILGRLDQLAASATATQLTRLTYFKDRINVMVDRDERAAATGGRATTAAAFKQVHYPQATLWQECCRSVAKGTPGVPEGGDAKEYFDPAPGRNTCRSRTR
jgi:hypothetical protein